MPGNNMVHLTPSNLFTITVLVNIVSRGKSKGKVNPRTGHEGPEGEKRYSTTLSLTLTLDGVGGQRDTLAAFPPRKTW